MLPVPHIPDGLTITPATEVRQGSQGTEIIMPDKGKVERFIRYLRQSFYIPLASRLAQEGLIVDRETANLAVRRWLREVANARIHGTTGEIPAERLMRERPHLQPIPLPYGGRTVRAVQARPEPGPIVGIQHPLSLYDVFAGAS